MRLHTTTAVHELPSGRIEIFGSAASVTPTTLHLDLNGATVLVDCGVALDRLPPRALQPQAVILTHAHRDHVDALPALLDHGFAGPVFATPPTLEITRHLLADGIRLKGGTDRDVVYFNTAFSRVATAAKYDAPFQPAAGVRAVLREAGHILGSASVELETTDSRVIISGDLGRPGSPILRDYCRIWSAHRPVDLVLCESTYGDREHAVQAEDLEERLYCAIQRALRDGGHILVPTFAIGRAQVLLYLLNNLVEAGRLPKLAVAIDTPLGLKILETYERFRPLYDQEALARIDAGDDPLDFDALYAVHRATDSVRLRENERPMLILAGSGMCAGGRILGHLRALIERPETSIIFAGFQAPGSPGREIQDVAAKGGGTVNLDGERVELKASVETLHGLSAHADQQELVSWLEGIPGKREVGLYHGEPAAQVALRTRTC